MQQQELPRWRPTRKQLLWAGGIAALTFLSIVICGYLFGWKWTGLPKRTLWDWLSLLIVPAVLALGGYLFTRSENQRTLQNTQRQRDLDRELATEQTETDRQLADQRAQDDALQAYLDQIGQLLLDKDRPLRQSKEGDEVRTLARARTLTVLRRLDGERKGRVMQFLYESGLIAWHHPILNLRGSDLREADLRRTDLSRAHLEGANLSGANLELAHLTEAILEEANLEGAFLRGATVNGAFLSGAILHRADLRSTDLSGANLDVADLEGANLTKTNLRRAKNVQRQLENIHKQLVHVKSLEGATMPNGQKYEDWLKGKDQEENKKSDGTS